MINSLQKSLEKIDIFGQTITLNMNKNAYYTTSFGGCSSILIICLLSIIFFSNISDFFSRANVFYDSQITFSNDPHFMEMNDQNAMFALSIDQANFTTNPFFNISVEQRIYTRSLDGSLNKSTIQIPLQPCTLDRFNNVVKEQGINIDFNDEFNYLSMNKWLCPALNYTLQLEGTYSSEIFKFIKIVVTGCKNNTNSSYWNPQCADEQQKTNYLKSEGQFKLQVFQINSMINPQQAQNYKTMYLDSDMYFSFVPQKLVRLANVYYRQYIVNNDESLLPYQDIKTEEMIIRKAEDFRDLTELGRDTDTIFATLYLRRSPFTEIINRNYQKVGDLLSYLGGFMQILKVIFGFFIAFYNRTSMLIELSNKLYDFKEVTNRSFLRKDAISQKTDQRGSIPDELSNKLQNLQNSDLNKGDWRQFINKLMERTSPIRLNVKILINQMSCGYFFNNNNSEFFTKAMLKINSELDLHNILHQLQEITKLKTVLLQKPQIILFNFTPKPIITLGQDHTVPTRLELADDINKQSYIKSNLDQLNEDLFTSLQEAYKTVSEEMEDSPNVNPCQKTINSKLTKQIDQELGKILKNQKVSFYKIHETNNINEIQEEYS
ncbi:unnamed protein product [Paramecium primaurelia]|uniref:Transmembrane protein n=1 Tax=Paramecium primaurelia TaxID=5886 RepID=A0A8S1PC42_PARPR|nr:unnamed protein product [Paramecium primaurelia]